MIHLRSRLWIMISCSYRESIRTPGWSCRPHTLDASRQRFIPTCKCYNKSCETCHIKGIIAPVLVVLSLSTTQTPLLSTGRKLLHCCCCFS
ncbi:hypothetical protein BDD12DRAFT_982222 [Trichophaea hybrida]|nr:hypothetical protein BDD12DRAFT_982222 [Trichophaea hybrida]